MRLLTTTAVLVILGAALAGCSSAGSAGSAPEAPTEGVLAPAGASTIEEVFDKVGCELNDIMGTNGRVEDFTFGPELERTGTCTPLDDGELVFFYEAASEDGMDDYIAGGKLEVGATDALYRDGAVLMLVTDAATAKTFGEKFESVG